MPKRKNTKIQLTSEEINPKIRTTKLDVEKKDVIADVSSLQSKILSRKIFIIILSVLLMAGVLYLVFKWLVIAWVDNKPVTRVTLYNLLEQRYGSEVEEQILVEALIEGESTKKGIKITEDDINQEISKTEQQVGGKETLQSLLAQQQISEDDFKKQLRLQLLVRKLFGENVIISDEEIKSYVEENKDNLTLSQIATDEAKLKIEVGEQLKQQKISQNFKTWIQEALNGPRVIKTSKTILNF